MTLNKSLLIKIAIAVSIVAAILFIIKNNNKKPKSSLIPASEGFEGDGLPEYEDTEYIES
jgi:hypothetical protein